MKILSTLFFVFSFCAIAISQDSLIVKVELRNSRHHEPVRNAHVFIELKDTTLSFYSNSYGDVHAKVRKGQSLGFQIRHAKYADANFERSISSRAKDDTIKYRFELDFIRTQEVDEMVVIAPGVPKKVYGSQKLHVSDFEILKDGRVLLLTYPKRLKKGSELVVWNGKRSLANLNVKDRAEELVRDFRGNPHVVCQNSVYGVYVNQESVGLATIEKDYFMKYVAPIVDTNKAKLYFSNFNPLYPAFDYFSFDRVDSAYNKILEIEDELMMELYRSEYKWADIRTKLWAKNKEYQTGVDAEIWVGMNYFTSSIYYKELYAPLFHRNDSLFVFDYYKDYLRTFNSEGEALDSISIYHHYDKRHTGWESELVQDRKTGQIYALYDRDGYKYIGYVDTKTGEIKEQVKLKHRYAHSVQVHGNHVYYIYRPFESAQKKYLYKERLPYEFGDSKVKNGELVTN